MKHFLGIALFTVIVSLIYTGIAQVLPQLENHPPAVVELGSNIGPEDLSAAGGEIFDGVCMQCHKMGEATRAPDLARIGASAAERAKERAAATGDAYTAIDYLVESLCQPGAYKPTGFENAVMPAQNKSLTGGQILAAVAFLQDQGDTATVQGTDVDPVERFGCVAAGGGGEVAAGPAPAPPPDQAFNEFGCVGCHMLVAPIRTLGPPLIDVGARLSKSEIYEAILDPDASMAEGDPPFPAGVMKATLEGNGFYERMKASDYRALVDWLAGHTGS